MLKILERFQGLKKTTAELPAQESSMEIEEHRKLARKYGLMTVSSTIACTKLVKVLQDEAITVFDLSKVQDYMDRKVRGHGGFALGIWYWFPLRMVDRATVRLEDMRESRERRKHQWTGTSGTFRTSAYDEIVPLPVLMTVDRIVERLGNKVSFFVAAIDNNPDPFLAVRMNDDPDRLFVIERWDEPGFRS